MSMSMGMCIHMGRRARQATVMSPGAESSGRESPGAVTAGSGREVWHPAAVTPPG